MKIFALSAFFWLSLCFSLNAQQIVNVNLLNNSNGEETDLVDLTDITNGEVSSQNVLLKELASNEYGYVEFEIDNLGESKVVFSLEEQGGGQVYAVNLLNGLFSIPTAPVNDEPYANGDIFKIERCSEGVFISKNGVSYHVFTSVDASKVVYSNLTVLEANLVGAASPNVLVSFPNVTSSCESDEPVINPTENCVVNSPITDDMFFEPSPCNDNDQLYFTYAEFQAASGDLENGEVLGYPISCNDGESESDSAADPGCNEDALDMLGATFGNMTQEDLFNCFDVFCSPMYDAAVNNLDLMTNLFDEDNINQITDLQGVIDETGEDVTSQDFLDELGYGGMGVDINDLAPDIHDALDGIENLQGTIEQALGLPTTTCDGESVWDELAGFEVSPDINTTPFGGGSNDSGGGQFIGKMETRISEMLGSMLMEDGVTDPNWFLGEIEGLGTASPDNLMPSPSATSTINSVQSGVDLYNGNGNFSLPLDAISSKDVSVPISIGSTPGGLKVDDQEGLLGSNMNLSAGGKVTRVVKGLPDEFNGEIEGLAYGYKRGLRPVVEFTGIDLGIEIGGSSKKWLKKILCAVFEKILKDFLDLPINGGCGGGAQTEITDNIVEKLKADPAISEELTEWIEEHLGGDVNKIVDFLNKRVHPFPNLNGEQTGNVKFEIFWNALSANYLNTVLKIGIPVGPKVYITVSIKFRAGVKVLDVPSEVVIKKQGIGYSHLPFDNAISDNSISGEGTLDGLDINDFQSLSTKEKLKYLKRTQTTKKRSDRAFFDPKVDRFMNVFNDLAGLFNSGNEGYPILNTEQLDLEPDEYYFDVGGYSGKFYIQPFDPNNYDSKEKIVLVPYQDLDIVVNRADVPNKDLTIESFVITTPEGVSHTFDMKAHTTYDSYNLPTSFKYDEIGDDWDTFKPPSMGKVEYPFFGWWMGLPASIEIKKDYMTNYYVEKGNPYISAWHVSNVHSMISDERIDFTYEQVDMNYNSSKNWVFSFPNFGTIGANPSTFATIPNEDVPDFPIRSPKEWKNGFADLTYSVSEVFVNDLLVKTIDNNRGKKAVFDYDDDNESIQGGKLCSKIKIFKNGDTGDEVNEFKFYKGWRFDYDTPQVNQTEVSCGPSTQSAEGGEGCVYAAGGEYKLIFDEGPKDDNDKFIFSFPMSISILEDCIRFVFAIKAKFDVRDKSPNGYYYRNEVAEYGSLKDLKVLLEIDDEDEDPNDDDEFKRFRGEFVRNYLNTVYEIAGDTEAEEYPIATMDYYDGKADIPKRFGMNQDIWGYYNDNEVSLSPFISQDYEHIPPLAGYGLVKDGQPTDHFAFHHPDRGDGDNNTPDIFDTGRWWKADLGRSEKGQLRTVTLETGAFFTYNYDLHQYPTRENFSLSGLTGGLRIESIEQGSENGPVRLKEYEFEEESIINEPLFISYSRSAGYANPNSASNGIPRERYYKDLELKIKTSWKPLNHWHNNKSGYVGYGKVSELYNDGDSGNGKIEHYFTTPSVEEYSISKPVISSLFVKYKRLFKWNDNMQHTLVESVIDESSAGVGYEPYYWKDPIVRNWRLGLEKGTRVLDAAGNEVQSSVTEYDFPLMTDLDEVFHYPTVEMFQFMHYGSYHDLEDAGALYQLVDAGTKCFEGNIGLLIRSLFKLFQNTVIAEHPYRYIDKTYLVTDRYVESEKVEIRNNTTYNTLMDGRNSVTTTYRYKDNSQERKVSSVTQDFSNGQNTETEYFYADDSDFGFSFIDETLLNNLDRTYNFESPIHTITKLNGDNIVGGSLIDFEQYGNRYLPETIWGYKNGKLSLTGRFNGYLDGMPTSYELAKFGTSENPDSYDFFPLISMSWNKNLLPVSRTIAEGGLSFTKSNVYNDLCQLESSTDVNGLTTGYTYDSRRRIWTITSPGDLQVTDHNYVMNPLSITTTTTFTDGTSAQGQTQNMDGWGNPLSVVRNDDKILSSTTYDDLFRPKTQYQIGSGTNTILYEPSPLSRVLSVTDAVDNVTSMEYYAHTETAGVAEFNSFFPFSGTFVTDANNHVSKGWTDAFGKSVISISGEGGKTRTKYDTQARVEKILNPIDEEYNYDYNSMGLLQRKEMPVKGAENFWYDNSMRLVAKSDANDNVLLMNYDDLYRLTNIYLASGQPGESNAGPVSSQYGGASIQATLLSNVYQQGTMWMKQVTEGILANEGVNGTKITVFNLDDYGRPENITTSYPTGLVYQDFQTINDAGLSPNTTTEVTGPDGVKQTLEYQTTFDNLLRNVATSLKLNNDPYKNLEEIHFNPLDQVDWKKIGYNAVNSNEYLQTIDYAYDDAGKLTSINNVEQSICLSEMDVCQLYWGTAGSEDTYDTGTCGALTSVTFDGETFPADPPILASDLPALKAFINSSIQTMLKVGDCKVQYQNVLGNEELSFSIKNTNIQEALLQFGAGCSYTFEQKACCTITAIDPSAVVSPLPGSTLDLFAESIVYDGLDISTIDLMGSCTGGFSRNFYCYDADHRLTKADNELYQPFLIDGALSTSYTYDPAGNIKTLNRNGWVPDANNDPTIGEYRPIDQLVYGYEGGVSSELIRVKDNVADELALLQGFEGAGGVAEYTYDPNGNLWTDSGKGISQNITYNLLNLPEKIQLGAGTIEHEYTFNGEKIKKEGEDTRFYIGGLEYKGTNLELINIPNGRILKEGTTNHYQYNLTDHLGNVVVMFEDVSGDGIIQIEEQADDDPNAVAEVLQRNLYYSFGMRVDMPKFQFGEEPENKYLYNGKELADDFGLDWHYYGFRPYDATIARFPNIDPIADRFAFVSGYNYAENSPIGNIDLWGLQAHRVTGIGGMEGTMRGPFTDSKTAQEAADKDPSAITYFLPEVNVDNSEEFIKKTSNGYSSGYKPGFNYDEPSAGALGGEFGAVSGEVYNNTNTGYFNLKKGLIPMAISAGGDGSLYHLKANGRLGSKLLGIGGSAEGYFYRGHANADLGIFTGERDRYGGLFDLNGGAYALNGEVKGGLNFLGMKWRPTIGGSLGAAHGGITVGAYYDNKTGYLILTGLEHAGFGIGQKLGLTVEIPVKGVYEGIIYLIY